MGGLPPTALPIERRARRAVWLCVKGAKLAVSKKPSKISEIISRPDMEIENDRNSAVQQAVYWPRFPDAIV